MSFYPWGFMTEIHLQSKSGVPLLRFDEYHRILLSAFFYLYLATEQLSSVKKNLMYKSINKDTKLARNLHKKDTNPVTFFLNTKHIYKT